MSVCGGYRERVCVLPAKWWGKEEKKKIIPDKIILWCFPHLVKIIRFFLCVFIKRGQK